MRSHYFAIVVINVVVIVSIIAGSLVGGTPTELKDRNFDSARISAFSQIRSSINTYYRENMKLPDSLTGLSVPENVKKDPQTGSTYTYIKLDGARFQLCTTFSTDSEEIIKKFGNDPYSYMNEYNLHKKGYDCISYDASK